MHIWMRRFTPRQTLWRSATEQPAPTRCPVGAFGGNTPAPPSTDRVKFWCAKGVGMDPAHNTRMHYGEGSPLQKLGLMEPPASVHGQRPSENSVGSPGTGAEVAQSAAALVGRGRQRGGGRRMKRRSREQGGLSDHDDSADSSTSRRSSSDGSITSNFHVPTPAQLVKATWDDFTLFEAMPEVPRAGQQHVSLPSAWRHRLRGVLHFSITEPCAIRQELVKTCVDRMRPRTYVTGQKIVEVSPPNQKGRLTGVLAIA